jgi:hypothetical protein
MGEFKLLKSGFDRDYEAKPWLYRGPACQECVGGGSITGRASCIVL